MNKAFLGFMKDRIIIVTGPPGAGKTTYAKQNRQPGDIVIDLDYLAAALMLSDQKNGDHSEVLSTALAIRDYLIDQIALGKFTFGRAIIVTVANAQKIQQKTGGQIITIDPGIEETMKRIDADQVNEMMRLKRRDLALKYYYQKDRKERKNR